MDELVRALAPYVGRVCGAIALDRGDDAVQETFIAVLRNLRSLREPAALHGWVRRIAVREAVRAGEAGRPLVADRRHRTRRRPLPDLDAALDVRAALAELRPDQRAVLVLRDLDGLSEADVAAHPRRARGHGEVTAAPRPSRGAGGAVPMTAAWIDAVAVGLDPLVRGRAMAAALPGAGSRRRCSTCPTPRHGRA